MKITRTANAGVLLEISGETFLVDGVNEEIFPYIKTPAHIRKELSQSYPDNVLFTHYHQDHYDDAFRKEYEKNTLRLIIGPESPISQGLKGAEIIPVSTRHIGKSDFPHVSFIINKDKSVWFMGDTSTLVLKEFKGFSKPDVLIVPYAYVNTSAALKNTKLLGAEKTVVLHLPERMNDEYRLWEAVEQCCTNEEGIYIPEIGETIKF